MMKEISVALLSFLIFPGFLFTAVVGLLAGWVDRKLTARIQWRVGPPWYQNFIDFLKLMSKETILPTGAHRLTFIMAPIIGLVGITLVSLILWQMNLHPTRSFLGDLIVVLCLSILPSLAVIIGGSTSANPLASLGTSREMRLLLAYKLPLIIAIFTPVVVIKDIRIGSIITYQMENGMMFTHHLSSLIAFILPEIFFKAMATLSELLKRILPSRKSLCRQKQSPWISFARSSKMKLYIFIPKTFGFSHGQEGGL